MNKGVRVEATISRIEKVTVSERELLSASMETFSLTDSLNVAMVAFKRKIGLGSDAYIRGEDWCHEVEHYGSHSWSTVEVIRKATADEIVYYEQLKELMDIPESFEKEA